MEVGTVTKGKRERKERTDKKVDVKPTITSELYDCITDLSYAFDMPIKDVVEFVCVEGINNRRVIEFMSATFRKDYWHNSTMYRGNSDLSHRRYIIRKVNSVRRISTRFTKESYDQIKTLAHSLDFTPSSATGFLLDCSVRNTTIIDSLARNHTSTFNDSREKALKSSMKYLGENNPYNSSIGFLEILQYLVEDVKHFAKKIKHSY
jgi:hypothetical protein